MQLFTSDDLALATMRNTNTIPVCGSTIPTDFEGLYQCFATKATNTPAVIEISRRPVCDPTRCTWALAVSWSGFVFWVVLFLIFILGYVRRKCILQKIREEPPETRPQLMAKLRLAAGLKNPEIDYEPLDEKEETGMAVGGRDDYTIQDLQDDSGKNGRNGFHWALC